MTKEEIEALPLNTRLRNLGFTTRKVHYDNGGLRGMAILKNGVPVHQTPVACYDYGLSLCESLEQQTILPKEIVNA